MNNIPNISLYLKGDSIPFDKLFTKYNVGRLAGIITQIESSITYLSSLHSTEDFGKLGQSLRDLLSSIFTFPTGYLDNLTTFPIEDPSWIKNGLGVGDMETFLNKCNFLSSFDLENDFLSEDLRNLLEELLEIIISLACLIVEKNSNEEDKLWGYVITHLFQDGFVIERIKQILLKLG